MAPPSVHESGQEYVWADEDTPLAPWPEKWNGTEKKRSEPVPDKIATGARNSTLTSIAGTMRKRGLGASVILAALTAVNNERCTPPLSDDELSQIAQSVARYEPEAKPLPAGDKRGPFQAALMSIYEGKSNPAVKAEAAGQLVSAHLATIGRFYIDKELSDGIGATENATYFFDNRTRELHRFDTDEFDAMLYDDTRISEKDPFFAKIKAHLHLVAVRVAERATLHTLSYYDEATKTLYIHRGGHHVYVLTGDEIRQANNGVGNVLFKHDTRGDTWEADFGYTGEPLLEMFNELQADQGPLTAEQLRVMLSVFCVLIGFSNVQRTKLIVTLVGEQGSGKSFLARRIGRLWCGKRWQVSSCEPDHENDAVLSLTTDRVTCFDNLDTRVPWVQDKLALAATGAQVQRRALYTNSDMIRSDIVSFIVVTSRDPRWIKREDVVQRMLPIKMAKREEAFIAENVLEALEEAARPARMGHLLTIANDVIKQLRDGATAKPTRLRIADFTFMGELAAIALGKGKIFSAAVETLPDEQRTFLTEDHPALTGIEEWLARGNYGREVEASQLYREVSEISGWTERSGIRNVRQLMARLVDFEKEVTAHLGPFTLIRDVQTGRQCYTFHTKDSDDYIPSASDKDLPF